MRVTLRTSEHGVPGFLDIGINQGAPNQGDIRWWEWQVASVRNTGGTWSWNWERVWIYRYVINLYADGNRFAILKFDDRIDFLPHTGPEPPQPWFVMADRGNVIFQPGRRIEFGAAEWSVLSMV